jgi:hypothetical protein
MIVLEVTHHAVERYQQRVAPVDPAQARAALSTPALQTAADFGAKYVKLGTGHHAVIEAHRVITVLPKEHPRAAMTCAARNEGNSE